MSEINSFSDYSSKYNTNQDYSFLFGAAQSASTSGSFKICVINGGVPLHLVAKNNEYELIAVFPPLSLASLNKLTSWNTMVEITNDGQKEVFSAFNLHRYRVKTTND